MVAKNRAHGEGRLEFLEAVNRMLDELVKRRTLDLVAANQRLFEEIATRKHAEQELERSRDELRSLAEHLQCAQQEEWARIARELADQIVCAVRTAASKQRNDSDAIAAAIADRNARPVGGERPLHESLSAQEFHVFMMLAAGIPLKEIAACMTLARTTIASYRTRVLEKMAMSRNSELVRYALKNGLLS
jgi:DNA-binding CsgD family transcriptional regulator